MAVHRGKQMKRKFSCVQGCSDCCIYREYYPSVEYGKIGVLVLPEEKAAIERLANDMGIRLRIIPRLAVGKNSPDKIIACVTADDDDDVSIWRYATATGGSNGLLSEGWILER